MHGQITLYQSIESRSQFSPLLAFSAPFRAPKRVGKKEREWERDEGEARYKTEARKRRAMIPVTLYTTVWVLMYRTANMMQVWPHMDSHTCESGMGPKIGPCSFLILLHFYNVLSDPNYISCPRSEIASQDHRNRCILIENYPHKHARHLFTISNSK